MNIMNSLGDALRDVITFVPKLLVFLAVLLIGWLIAKGLRKLVTVGLQKVGFDRAVERGGIKNALRNSKYDAIGIVGLVVFWGIMLIALQIAFGAFGPNPVSALLTEIVAWLPRLVVAIVIVVVAAAIARALADLTASALGGVSWGSFASKAVFGFVIALGVIAALGQIGVATLVTAPVLIAVLATIGGILVVGVGGGMVKPMQQRWERWLHRAETEAPAARDQVQAYRRGREDAMRAEQPATQPEHAEVRAGQHAAAPGTTGTEGMTGSTGIPGVTGAKAPPPQPGSMPTTPMREQPPTGYQGGDQPPMPPPPGTR